MKKRLFLAFLATSAMACSGDDGDGNEPQFEMPQILPDQSPICVSYREVNVGGELAHNVLLTNEGRQALMIMGGEITDDMEGNFVFDEARTSANDPACSDAAPCSLEFDEQASVRFFYRPMSAGWHTANLVVRSNAENFPTLRTFILAKAAPMGEDPATWDAGPKPDAANPGMPTESCRAEDAP